MNGNIDWFIVFVALCCLMGFTVSLILHFSHRGSRFLARLLAAMLFCLSYSLFGYLLYISGEFLRVPHLYRTPAFFSLCIAPLTYIYIRSSLSQQFHFKKWDFLFFIPAVLYTLQLIPFYLLPDTEKISFIEAAIQNKSVGAREPEGLLPQGLGFAFRIIFSLSLMVATFFNLFKWIRSEGNILLDIKGNATIFRWLIYLNLVMVSTFIVLMLNFVFHLTHLFEQYRISTITLTFSIFFICFYLLFKPEILYGLQGWITELPEENIVHLTAVTETKNKRILLTDAQMDLFEKKIQGFFSQNQPFLKPRYTIRDLSSDVRIPSYLLSSFVNQRYGKNFSEFINDYRVDYIIGWVQKEPEILSKYTFEVLGQMGGFASRASFISSVKRKTGKTPSEIFVT